MAGHGYRNRSVDFPARFNVLGTAVHALDLDRACALVVEGSQKSGRGRYVCCCDAHSITRAKRSPEHRRALNAAYLATPDGMPLVWLGRLAGFRNITRVYGPDLMLAVCRATAGGAYSHFLYGAAPGTADELAARLTKRFPGLRITGTHSPPFGPLDTAEGETLASRLRELRPDFLWIGLGTPKQEAFMARHAATFDCGIALGVGAAFDMLTDRVRQAPRWIQRSGFEWMWRLSREPRRLGPRYLRTAPAFALGVLGQLSGFKRYPLSDDEG